MDAVRRHDRARRSAQPGSGEDDQLASQAGAAVTLPAGLLWQTRAKMGAPASRKLGVERKGEVAGPVSDAYLWPE